MGISPWSVGQTGESFTIYCKKDNSIPFPLTNADGSLVDASSLTLLIKPAVGSEVRGGGLFSITDHVNGIVQYQPAGSDVQVAGSFEIAVEVQTAEGPVYSDRTTWDITSR